MKILFYSSIYSAFILFLLLGSTVSLMAEGSIDFRNYAGNRLFYNVEQNQQLKVYVNGGEFINVGSSHVGINGGYMEVYSPSGSLVATFDGQDNRAIIFNDEQELNGPIGNEVGYRPGIIAVPIDSGGIWSIRLRYPNPQRQRFFSNLQNGDAWTRAADQPQSSSFDQRVALAWDVTVTQNAAGDNGGIPVMGRLYSNEFISILDGNNREGAERATSPIFYVLAKGGYLYEVAFNHTDPWGFPIHSNNLGLVRKFNLFFLDNFFIPTYMSAGMGGDTITPNAPIIRSANPNEWEAGKTYLYDPQAEDFGPLINNKIFFNLPDTMMPSAALVTDVNAARPMPYTTWLLNQVPPKDNSVRPFTFKGRPPATDSLEAIEGLGGHFIFNSNLEGQATLILDFNNNGLFTDAVDDTLRVYAQVGLDSIPWDGKDGIGNIIPTTNEFRINYSLTIRGAENHILLADVENNIGGVQFIRINGPGSPDSTFYYNHSNIGGGISGNGGTFPEPTIIPFTYRDSFGDKNMLDQWAYIETSNFGNSIIIDIKKLCEIPATPTILSSATTACEGDSLTLSTAAVMGRDIRYIWTFTNAEDSTEIITTIPNLTLNPAQVSNSGSYTLTVAQDTCISAPSNTIDLNIEPSPPTPTLRVEPAMFCENARIEFTTTPVAGAAYEWLFTQPSGNVVSLAITSIPSLVIEHLSVANTGNYQVVLILSACRSMPSNSVPIEVIIPDITDVIASSSAPLDNPACAGSTITLSVTAVTNATYEWVKIDSDSIIGDTRIVTLTNATSADNGLYQVSLTIDNCPTTIDPVMVVVEPNPDPPSISVNKTTICTGESFTLRTDALLEDSIMYDWFFNGMLFATTRIPELLVPNVTAANMGEYAVAVKNNTCFSGISTPIGISVIPLLEGTITVEPITPICAGTTVTLSAPMANGATYFWTGPSGFTATSAIITLEQISIMANPSYSVAVTVDGCINNFGPILLDVEPIPNTPTISVDKTSVCLGESLTLNTSTVEGAAIVYDWLFNDEVLASTSIPTFTVDNFQTEDVGEYAVLVREGICASNPSTPITISLQAFEDISVMSNSPVCLGEPINLRVTATSGATYQWEGPNNFSTTTFNPTIEEATEANEGNYTVMVTIPNCHTMTATTRVIITPKTEEEAIILTNPAGDECGNIPTTVTAETPLLGTGVWTSDNPTIVFINSTSPITEVLNLANGDSIIWTLSNDTCGVYSRASIMIDVIVPPTIANDEVFTILNTESIINQDIAANDTPNDGRVTVINAPSNGIGTIAANGILNYTPNDRFVGIDQLVYELCNVNCPLLCDQATITIMVNQDSSNFDCVVPDIITPNGDGLNDVLNILCADFKSVDLKVYNRWGGLVYESDNYNNDWNGTDDGVDLPPGPYYYIFKEAEPSLNPALTTGSIAIIR